MGLLLLKLLQEWTAVRRSMKSSGETPVETEEEQELRRLQEDRAAFADLMSYNVQRAYGREE